MRRVFSGDNPNLKEFSWLETNAVPVNSKEETQKKTNGKLRPKQDLKIERVLSPQEEKLLEKIKKEEENIKQNIKKEIKKEIEEEKKEYLFFKERIEELDNIKKEAYDKGYKEGLEAGKREGEAIGYKNGLEKAQREFEEKLEMFGKNLAVSIENIELFKEKVLNNAKADTLELAVLMAKKIVSREITLNPETFISIIEESLKNITAKDKINIFLNNEDYNLIKQKSLVFADNDKIILSSDSKLKRGEIKIISDLEQLSYSIDENIEKLGENLKNELIR